MSLASIQTECLFPIVHLSRIEWQVLILEFDKVARGCILLSFKHAQPLFHLCSCTTRCVFEPWYFYLLIFTLASYTAVAVTAMR